MGRGIALLFHDRGSRRGWVVSSTPRLRFTPGKDPVPIIQEAGWALDRSGRAENLVPTTIRSRTVQPIVSRCTDWATRPTFQIYPIDKLLIVISSLYHYVPWCALQIISRQQPSCGRNKRECLLLGRCAGLSFPVVNRGIDVVWRHDVIGYVLCLQILASDCCYDRYCFW